MGALEAELGGRHAGLSEELLDLLSPLHFRAAGKGDRAAASLSSLFPSHLSSGQKLQRRSAEGSAPKPEPKLQAAPPDCSVASFELLGPASGALSRAFGRGSEPSWAPPPRYRATPPEL
ncbi:hypothetical protein J1605_014379 [Eschrichtius robustus]|uniref:Uncharacterized protein n=1 Tax=Eschrichtius robustus TaxID=9764 RepID=A0AB34GDF1_ESCRO|nr:hypothetical protein J1605_014379 [Eschrichtius robustus]